MPTCPRCMLEFFISTNGSVAYDSNKGEILAHDCHTGYIKPYRAVDCEYCHKAKIEYSLKVPKSKAMTTQEIVNENRRRKLSHFRQMDMRAKGLEDDEPKKKK